MSLRINRWTLRLSALLFLFFVCSLFYWCLCCIRCVNSNWYDDDIIQSMVPCVRDNQRVLLKVKLCCSVPCHSSVGCRLALSQEGLAVQVLLVHQRFSVTSFLYLPTIILRAVCLLCTSYHVHTDCELRDSCIYVHSSTYDRSTAVYTSARSSYTSTAVKSTRSATSYHIIMYS